MSTLSLADARTYAANGFSALAYATGTSEADKATLLDAAAKVGEEMTPHLARGNAVALACVLAAGENAGAATVAATWCGVLWARWQGSPVCLELGAPPPPPPP